MIPLLVAIPAGLAAAAAAGTAYYLTKKKGKIPGAAEMADLAARVATKGPKGEYVFKSDLADSILRSLGSQAFKYPDQNDRRYVEIFPFAHGVPVSGQSARDYANTMNVNQSILAPLYLATATTAQRFLRAVDSGNESAFAGEGGMYAVLLYAGALQKGLAPPGSPSVPTPGAPIPVDPLKAATAQLPAELQAEAAELLAHGTDPVKMEQVAAELEKDGLFAMAKLLREKAAALRAAQATTPINLGLPAPSVVRPGTPSTAPALSAQQAAAAAAAAATAAQQAAAFAAAKQAVDLAIASDPNKARAAAAQAFETALVTMQQGENLGTATVVTQRDPLSVRDKPNGKLLGGVAKGTIVDIVRPDSQQGGLRDGFYFVRIPNPSDKIYGMKYGWVSATLLRPNGDAALDPSVSSLYIPWEGGGGGKPFGFPGFTPTV